MKPIQQWTSRDILQFLKGVDKKTWVVLGVWTGVFLLAVIFIAYPAWVTRAQIRKEISIVRGQIKSIQSLKLREAEWTQNKQKFHDLIQDAKNRLFLPSDANLLLGLISKLATESKISIVSSTPKEFDAKFEAPFNELYSGNLYEFVVEGGYHALGQFVSRIESNSKLLRIRKVEIRPHEDAPNLQTASLELTAVSYKKEPLK